MALHFAIADPTDPQPSVVWSLDFVRVQKYLPSHLRDALQGTAAAFTTDMLDDSGIPVVLEGGEGQDEAYLLVIEPLSIDERIVNQYAGLTAFSSTSLSLCTWLETLPDTVAIKIKIDQALKWEAREKLDQAGINERVIYPGLDGLATWLTRYYTSPPRGWVK